MVVVVPWLFTASMSSTSPLIYGYWNYVRPYVVYLSLVLSYRRPLVGGSLVLLYWLTDWIDHFTSSLSLEEEERSSLPGCKIRFLLHQSNISHMWPRPMMGEDYLLVECRSLLLFYMNAVPLLIVRNDWLDYFLNTNWLHYFQTCIWTLQNGSFLSLPPLW